MASVALAARSIAAPFALGLVLLGVVQARRVRRAVRCEAHAAHRIRPFERHVERPAARVLVLGDSTGVGIGAERPEDSIAGLLAREHAEIDVVNHARPGARVEDVIATARHLRQEGERFDVALLHAGGNDVLHATSLRAMRENAERLLVELAHCSRHTIWLGAANVGLAPMFVPPFSWWLSHRGRLARSVLAGCARHAGAEYLDFYRDRRADPFHKKVRVYYASDRVHPSSASYAYCYRALKDRTTLLRWVGRASLRRAAGRVR